MSAEQAILDLGAAQRLPTIAARVCWWEPPEHTLADIGLFLCRVMVIGTWEDICYCLERFGMDEFRTAIRRAPPGLFDVRSWHYWHHRLGLAPVPALPIRVIPV